MAARQFLAAIERRTPGTKTVKVTLEVIATGAKQHCEGALSAWRSFAHADTEDGIPMLVVVEPEGTPDTEPATASGPVMSTGTITSSSARPGKSTDD